MERIGVQEANSKNNKKYFWSPSLNWEQIDNKIKIEIFIYPEIAAELFPKFYFITQNGKTVEELMNEFPEVNKEKLKALIKDFIKKKVLVSSLLTPQEVFYPMKKLVKSEYGDDLMYNPEESQKFKIKQLNRSFENCKEFKILLSNNDNIPETMKSRYSYREFDEETTISFEGFSNILASFKQIRENEEHTRYYYASAGGLYPLDVFIYIKDKRVENVRKGLYYYNPVDNSISMVNDANSITDEAHFFINKKIFNSSAFSIFIVYNAEANMPKYKGMGYFYACIDTGIMVSTLTQSAELNGLGLCSIGDMDFRKVEKYFNLNENQVFLHDIELGLKPKEMVKIV